MRDIDEIEEELLDCKEEVIAQNNEIEHHAQLRDDAQLEFVKLTNELELAKLAASQRIE